MLDLLGFQQLVENTTDKELSNMFEKLTEIVASSLNYTLKYENGEREFVVSGYQTINYLIITDTIVMWTNDSSYGHFHDLVTAVKLVFYHCFKQYLPIRGAIVCDSITFFDRQLPITKRYIEASVIGKAILKAYKLGNSQDWMGCYIHDDCITKNDQDLTAEIQKGGSINNLPMKEFDAMNFRENIINTDIPFKEGVKKGHAIQWVKMGANIEAKPEQVLENFEYKKGYNGEESVKKKIENTVKFIEIVTSNSYNT